MTGNPEVIAALRAALPLEVQLNEQYCLDWRCVKFQGVKKVASKLRKFADDASDFRSAVVDRIEFLGGDPSYQIGPVREQGTLTATLRNALALEQAVVAPYEQAIVTAVSAKDDATRNLFEHLVKWHQGHIAWLERQLRLIAALSETTYVSAKL